MDGIGSKSMGGVSNALFLSMTWPGTRSEKTPQVNSKLYLLKPMAYFFSPINDAFLNAPFKSACFRLAAL
jgi:hypothetical protein